MTTTVDARAALPWRGDPAEIVAAFDPDLVHRDFVAYVAGAVPAWHARAACAGTPLELFFPSLGHSTAPAKAICERCPVRADCLAEALADDTLDHGIRGGLSARQRKALRRPAITAPCPAERHTGTCVECGREFTSAVRRDHCARFVCAWRARQRDEAAT